MVQTVRPAILGGPPSVSTTYSHSWPHVTAGLEQHVLAALRSGRLNYGPGSVSRCFEEAFADIHGRRFALATNSGTIALLASYVACFVRSDSEPISRVHPNESPEVIVPGYGFFATASPLIFLGIRPVFCDVSADTGNLDPILVRQLINHRTRGIVVTHVSGHPADMSQLCQIAEENDVPLLEDCSHAHGARYEDRLVGTFGRCAAFSLQISKMLCAGEGGIFLTEDETLFRVAALLVNFRRLHDARVDIPPELLETGFGLKLRIGPLDAAMAHYHLEHLDELIEARQANLSYLTKCLLQLGHLVPPTTRPGTTRGAYYEYHVKYPDELAEDLPLPLFRQALVAEGVILPHSNTRACYRLPLFSIGLRGAIERACGGGCDEVGMAPLPVADSLERTVFSLPTFTGAPTEVLDQYVDAIAKVLSWRTVLRDRLPLENRRRGETESVPG